MCGIAGFWGTKKVDGAPLDILRRMTDAISYRGPDDSGYWCDEASGIGLGHRRLSILDLSPAGHQPMFSACGRFCIVFNGEVYNYEQIRKELPPRNWRGHSDTEVMIEAIAEWGIHAAVKRFVGMFAFAVWDRQTRSLSLVRDRLGIKPLYYGWTGSTLLFGSELKALRAFPGFSGEIDRNSVALLMRHNYIPAPYSIYQRVHKLLPGTVLTLTAPEGPNPVAFWSAREVAEAGVRDPFRGSEAEAIDALEQTLSEAVRLRMIADVPLGAFLSGGVDSSAVVALMQANSQRPVRTFSIGFSEDGYNEAVHAAEVARHLRTDHTELYVSPEQAQSVVPTLGAMYDEPFSDSSQIPTFLVSRLARSQVTVSLSGDGGDELFGGYTRYMWTEEVWKRQQRIPYPLRAAMAALIHAAPAQLWDRLFALSLPLLPARFHQAHFSDKLNKLADLLSLRSPQQLYHSLISHSKDPKELAPGSLEPPTRVTDPQQWAEVPTLREWMMYLDLVSYLPDDILTKVDRASMAVSLEARVPMLDHRVVEFAWKIPSSMKVRAGEGKWLLRQVLYRHVPKSMIERPKMGFGVPLGAWLRGALRDWAEELLSPDKFQHGYLDPAPIRMKWKEHLSGRRNWQYELWNVLMFQAWYQEQHKKSVITFNYSYC